MRTWALALTGVLLGCSSDSFTPPPDASAQDVVTSDVADAADCTDTKSDPKNCGECGHGCGLLGKCISGTCVADVVSNTGPTTCVDLDVGNVYWAGGNIQPGKAPKLNPKNAVYGTADVYSTCRLIGTNFYVIQSGAGLVMSLKTSDLSFFTYVANGGQQGASEMAVLGTVNGAAWLLPATGKVVSCPAPPCGATPNDVATGEAGPSSIAVDATHIYWASLGAGASDGAIKRRLRANIGPVDTVLAGIARPVAIALDGNDVFFGREDGTIATIPKSGGTPQLLAQDVAPGAFHMTTDATHVYWTNTGAGTVNRVKKSGGAILPLAIQQTKPWDIAVDATDVYWTTNSNGGGVFRVNK